MADPRAPSPSAPSPPTPPASGTPPVVVAVPAAAAAAAPPAAATPPAPAAAPAPALPPRPRPPGSAAAAAPAAAAPAAAPEKPNLDVVFEDAQIARGWFIEAKLVGRPGDRYEAKESKEAKAFAALREALPAERKDELEAAKRCRALFDNIPKKEAEQGACLLNGDREGYEAIGKQIRADYAALQAAIQRGDLEMKDDEEKKKVAALNAEAIETARLIGLARAAKADRERFHYQYIAGKASTKDKMAARRIQRDVLHISHGGTPPSLPERNAVTGEMPPLNMLKQGTHISASHPDKAFIVSYDQKGAKGLLSISPQPLVDYRDWDGSPVSGTFTIKGHKIAFGKDKYIEQYKKGWDTMVGMLINSGVTGPISMSSPDNFSLANKRGDCLIAELRAAFEVVKSKGLAFDDNGWMQALRARGASKSIFGLRYQNYSAEDLNKLELEMLQHNSNVARETEAAEAKAKASAVAAVADEKEAQRYIKELPAIGARILESKPLPEFAADHKESKDPLIHAAMAVYDEVGKNSQEFKKLDEAQGRIGKLLERMAGFKILPDDTIPEAEAKREGCKKAHEALKKELDEVKGVHDGLKDKHKEYEKHIASWEAHFKAPPPLSREMEREKIKLDPFIQAFKEEIKRISPTELNAGLADVRQVAELINTLNKSDLFEKNIAVVLHEFPNLGEHEHVRLLEEQAVGQIKLLAEHITSESSGFVHRYCSIAKNNENLRAMPGMTTAGQELIDGELGRLDRLRPAYAEGLRQRLSEAVADAADKIDGIATPARPPR